MVTAIKNKLKIQNIDPSNGKYAVNLQLAWTALTADPTVVVPGTQGQLATGVMDTFSLLLANAAAQVPKIRRVVGSVFFFPESTAPATHSGGFYIYSPDSGQLIALEQFLNGFDLTTHVTSGQVNNGAISFSLPIELASNHSSVQLIKLIDTDIAMRGVANISFLTYDTDTFISR